MKVRNVPESLTAPHWIKSCTRRFMVGFHLPDYDQIQVYPSGISPILSKFDASDFVKTLKRSHVQMFWFYNKCHMGNSYHPSVVPQSHVHSAMKGRDFFGEITDACLDEGIVPGCVYEFSDYRIMRDKPDWCHRIPGPQIKGDMTDAVQGSRVGGPCLNGPYGDYVIAQTVETIKNYPVQGYYVDFLGFMGDDKWICQHGCNDSLNSELGFEFRGIEHLSHEQYVKYLKWKFEQYDRYCNRLLKAMREARPDIVFLHNAHLVSDKPNLQTYELAGRNCDYMTGDLFSMRGGTLQMSTILRSYAGASRFLPAESLLDSAISMGHDFFTPKALDSYRAELWTARSVNVTNCTSISMNIDGTFDRSITELVKKVYEDQIPYEPWLKDMRFEASVGLVRSQNTIFYRPDEFKENLPQSFYRVDYGAPLHSMDFKGWAQTLIASHHLWDVVQDYQLTDEYLRRFKVVILPNAACLSIEQCNALERFTRSGGTLIATGETSLYDENGLVRKDFALSSTLGVHYTGPREPEPARLLFEDRRIAPKEGFVAPFVFFHAGYWPVKAAKDTKPLGMCAKRIGDTGLIFPYLPTGKPILTQRKNGKGTAFYCAGMPGLEYRVCGFTSQKRMMTRILDLAVGRSSPVLVQAPATVEVFAHRQDGKENLVVNLVNWVSGVSRSDGSFGINRGKLIIESMRFDETEHMPPASGVTVRFRPNEGRKPIRVCLAPSRKQLPMRKIGKDIEVSLPPFDVHAMLVAEYRSNGRVGRGKQISR